MAMMGSTRSMRVGKQMKALREEARLTQDDLASRAQLASGALIAQYEAGTKMPSLDKSMDLAIQLGVSLSELVGEHARGTTARITCNANGDHQTVYQHVEGLMLTDDLEATLARLVTRVLDAQRPMLLEAVTTAVRQVLQAGQGQDGPAAAP
jgi:transcriptional regulator with XRE-family HTH domain